MIFDIADLGECGVVGLCMKSYGHIYNIFYFYGSRSPPMNLFIFIKKFIFRNSEFITQLYLTNLRRKVRIVRLKVP